MYQKYFEQKQMLNAGPVLYKDLFATIVLQFIVDGHYLLAFPNKSFLMIAIVVPAGPAFFYAPAQIIPYLEISTGLDKKLELISQISG